MGTPSEKSLQFKSWPTYLTMLDGVQVVFHILYRVLNFQLRIAQKRFVYRFHLSFPGYTYVFDHPCQYIDHHIGFDKFEGTCS